MAVKVLDLFCGRGGWTKGFMAEGFECVGVDIVSKRYPGELVLADLRTFRPKGDFEVIVASPPCNNFTRVKRTWKPRGMSADFKGGLELVEATFQIIGEVNPAVWLLENVCDRELALEMLPREPKLEFSHSLKGRRWVWSNMDFPFPFIPYQDERNLNRSIRDPWRRAEIPFSIARAVARAVRQGLQA